MELETTTKHENGEDHSCAEDLVCFSCQENHPVKIYDRERGIGETFEKIHCCQGCVAQHDNHDIVPEHLDYKFTKICEQIEADDESVLQSLIDQSMNQDEFSNHLIHWKDRHYYNRSMLNIFAEYKWMSELPNKTWMSIFENVDNSLVTKIMEQKDTTGHTCISTASRVGNAKFLELIFEKREAKVWREAALQIIEEEHEWGDSALSTAVFHNQHQCQKILLSEGAKISGKTKQYAEEDGDENTKKLIAEHVLKQA